MIGELRLFYYLVILLIEKPLFFLHMILNLPFIQHTISDILNDRGGLLTLIPGMKLSAATTYGYHLTLKLSRIWTCGLTQDLFKELSNFRFMK